MELVKKSQRNNASNAKTELVRKYLLCVQYHTGDDIPQDRYVPQNKSNFGSNVVYLNKI